MILMISISIVIYIVATVVIYANTYSLEKEKRITFVLIGLVSVLLVTSILVMISSASIQVPKKEYLTTANITSILLFAPVNSVLFLAYLGQVLNKQKQKRLKDSQVKKRIIFIAVIAVFILIMEVGYIQNFEIGLLKTVM